MCHVPIWETRAPGGYVRPALLRPRMAVPAAGSCACAGLPLAPRYSIQYFVFVQVHDQPDRNSARETTCCGCIRKLLVQLDIGSNFVLWCCCLSSYLPSDMFLSPGSIQLNSGL
jgi:hypothetical protein